ncbi:hypothetical protein AgCh_023103 [Apium graveolens]
MSAATSVSGPHCVPRQHATSVFWAPHVGPTDTRYLALPHPGLALYRSCIELEQNLVSASARRVFESALATCYQDVFAMPVFDMAKRAMTKKFNVPPGILLRPLVRSAYIGERLVKA